MKKRIIVALDVDSPETGLLLANHVQGEVGLFKVGMELFPRGGPDLLARLMACPSGYCELAVLKWAMLTGRSEVLQVATPLRE